MAAAPAMVPFLLTLPLAPVVPAAPIQAPAPPVATVTPSVQNILATWLSAHVSAGGSTSDSSYHHAYLLRQAATATPAPPHTMSYVKTHMVSTAPVPHPPGRMANDSALLPIVRQWQQEAKQRSRSGRFQSLMASWSQSRSPLSRFSATKLTASSRLSPTRLT